MQTAGRAGRSGVDRSGLGRPPLETYPARDPVSGKIQTIERALVPPRWHHLRALLLDTHRLEAIRGYDEAYLSIHTPDVLARIRKGDPSWEGLVAKNLFDGAEASGSAGRLPSAGDAG